MSRRRDDDDKRERSVFDIAATRPRLIVALWTIAAVVALVLVLRLKPETSLQELLNPDDPAIGAMSRVMERFPVVEELLVFVEMPAGTEPAEPQKLEAFAQRLGAAIKDDPEARTLVSNLRYRAGPQFREFVQNVVVPNGLLYLGDEQAKQLLSRLTRAGMDEQLAANVTMMSVPGPAAGGISKVIAKDPLRLHEFLLARLGELHLPGGANVTSGSDLFLSKDATGLLIRIDGTKPPSDLEFCRKITGAVTRLAQSVNGDHLTISMTGAYAAATHEAALIRRDAIENVVGSVVGLAVLFLLLFRRPVPGFLLAFLPVVIGLLVGFGVYAAFRHTITPLAAVIGGALAGIGIDYSIQLLARYYERRASAENAVVAARVTLHEVSRAMFGAWLTSVIGFLAVGWSPVRVLLDFALIGSLCLAGAWLSTMLLLPALLVLLDRPQTASAARGLRIGAFDWLGRQALRVPRWLFVIGIAVMVCGVAVLVVKGVPTELESDLLVLHTQPNPPLDAQRHIGEQMDFNPGLFVYARADSPEKLLRITHDVDRRLADPTLRRIVDIRWVFGLASLLPDPAVVESRRELLKQQPTENLDTDLRAALQNAGFNSDSFAGYLVFLHRLISPTATAPTPADLVQYPEVAHLVLPHEPENQPITESITYVSFGRPLDDRSRRDMALSLVNEALRGVPDVTVTGMPAISHDIDQSIGRDLPRVLSIAVACIVMYLLLHFRSVKRAALAMTPTVASVIVVLVVMRLFDVKLNLVNVVMIPLLLAITVDYGIFTLVALEASADEAGLKRRFPLSFAAVFVCAMTAALGIGTLATTSVPAVRSLGVLVSVGIGASVVGILVLQWPAMIRLSRRHDNRQRPADPAE